MIIETAGPRGANFGEVGIVGSRFFRVASKAVGISAIIGGMHVALVGGCRGIKGRRRWAISRMTLITRLDARSCDHAMKL